MVVQLVKASIKPEQRDRWLEVIERNARDTRAERGCELFQVAEDVETPNTFVIVELWTDLEVVYAHFRNQFEGLMAALGDVLVEPPQAWIHEVSETHTLDDVLAAAGVAR